MLKDNEKIIISGDEAIKILADIEYMLISLRNIARYYFHRDDNATRKNNFEYFLETTRFIDENKITYRLANIRTILSEKFDDTLGMDDMDDIEREMEKIKFWEKPGD